VKEMYSELSNKKNTRERKAFKFQMNKQNRPYRNAVHPNLKTKRD
jgi:hypothetical protein